MNALKTSVISLMRKFIIIGSTLKSVILKRKKITYIWK